MAKGISEFNRAFGRIPKRAEQRHADQLRETFEESGVGSAVQTIDHQIVYGRRGTGKTHALRYLESEVANYGDYAAYIDLRTIGSPEGIYRGDRVELVERASRLLIDLLSAFYDSILDQVLREDEGYYSDELGEALDKFSSSISTVRIEGEVDIVENHSTSETRSSSLDLSGTVSHLPSLSVGGSHERTAGGSGSITESRSGQEYVSLNFTVIARTLRDVAKYLGGRRVWILLDEWSSLPSPIQPVLADFLVKCVLPLQQFTLKVASIEQESNFQSIVEGRRIGFEVGADIAANINLDEFMVYEADVNASIEFFRGLFFKHLKIELSDTQTDDYMRSEKDLVRTGFTEKRAFEELVRAAEGVPRDAINIAAIAARRAGVEKISVKTIRSASREWFKNDKEAALRAVPNGIQLLNWIIDKVIMEKKTRGFLVSQRSEDADILRDLFKARVLHLVKKGYSAQDEPGKRYDVWVIDYGAYVDLIRTKNEPQELDLGVLELTNDEDIVEVPQQDLRGIRRAVLRLEEFNS